MEFAELEDFIDNQVKFYSSGMFVRLGFAVAVHVDPEILLVDEVLAVGDEAFQRKCLDRVRGFQREGRTIVFVTPRARPRAQVCDRAVMLDHGELYAKGSPTDVVRELRLRPAEQRPRLRRRGGHPRGRDRRRGADPRRTAPPSGRCGWARTSRSRSTARANQPVDDLGASFQVLDSANHPSC